MIDVATIEAAMTAEDPYQALVEMLRNLRDDVSATRHEATQAREEAAGAHKQAKDTNGRVRDVEHVLHGPEDRAGNRLGGGLVGEFREFKQWVRARFEGVDRQVNDVSERATGQSAGATARQTTLRLIIGLATLLVTSAGAMFAALRWLL